MRRVLTALLGLAALGAIFAAAYYQPSEVERERTHPKFRLAPGEAAADFIEPLGQGENVTVNITVLVGGPVDVYVMDMENLTFHALNSTSYGFDIGENLTYDRNLSKTNVTRAYNFSTRTDADTRHAILLVSRAPGGPETGPDNVTELAVAMRYTDREQRSLVLGYILVAPALALVAYTLYQGYRRSRFAGEAFAPPGDDP